MAKFAAVFLSFDESKEGTEAFKAISSTLVKHGYFFTVRYHKETPWIQIYVEDPEKIISYALKISQIFRDKRVIGLAAYTVSDSVSFCEFQGGKTLRLLQSGFNNERLWDLIEGEKQFWESDILEPLTMKVGQPGMVSSHINQIGVFLNLPGFGIPRPGEAWTQEILNG